MPSPINEADRASSSKFVGVIVALSLCDDDVEAHRAVSIAAVALCEREGGIVAADATTDAGKGFTLRIVARAATETISIAKLNDWRIRKRGSQRGLIVPRRFSWNGEPDTEIACEADVARSIFKLFCFAAAAEEKSQAAGFILS